ncbi:MAG: DNA polymerase domain-containing protein [Candidatus Micrarchaeia archaeon]|jgi:DNA polymerase I
MEKKAQKRRATLIDVDYKIVDDRTVVRLLMKGKHFFRLYAHYEPYFYVDAPAGAEKEILAAKAQSRERMVSPVKLERARMNVLGSEKEVWKVYCARPFDVPSVSGALKYPCYENNIPFGRRYMIDNGLAPFTEIWYVREGRHIKKIIRTREATPALRTMAFDIETYNPKGMPQPERDEVIMISYEMDGERRVITSKKIDRPFVIACKDEREMIKKFLSVIKEKDVEVLLGYNSTVFDLPYLAARAQVNGLEFSIGRDGSSFRVKRRGIRDVAEINGRIHVDLYPLVRFMGFIGAFKISKYTLENAYTELTGKKKLMVKKLEIYRMWDDDGLVKELADYSAFDSQATMEIGKLLVPLMVEMGRLTRLPLFDAVGATAGQLVESLLMQKSFEHHQIIPNKPNDALAQERELGPIQGAFVKLPQPGIYENMVVFDFRGLYPSIITSHNIDPYTLSPPESVPDSECYISPNGHRFSKKPRGLLPVVLEELIKKRGEMKNRLKKAEKDTPEYEQLFARVQSLKILANSYYGYLAYPRSRWYSRECGESVTAWGRHFIQETIEKGEKAGFSVLYGDSLPPERKIVVQRPDGEVAFVKIGEFVDAHVTDKRLGSYKTLAFDGKRLVFAPIKRAIRHDYPKETGGLLEIITRNGKTVVTPQHSVYKYDGGVKLADAKELKTGDFLVSLTNAPAQEIYKEGHEFDIATLDFGKKSGELWLYSDRLQFPAKKGKCPYCGKGVLLANHVSLMHRSRRVPLSQAKQSKFEYLGSEKAKGGKIPRRWKLTRELAWLFGYYAAEGSVSERSEKHSKEMVSFGSQDRKVIEHVKEIIEKSVGCDLAIIEDFDSRIQKKMFYYRVQCVAIGALFAHGFGLGKGSAGKRVPEIILNAEEKLRRAFLDGYFEGDGTKWHDPRYRTHFQKISTKSEELAMGVQYLYKTLSTRQKNAFGKRIEHVYWRYRKDKQGIIDLRFQAVKEGQHENFCAARIKEINRVEYSGHVYDLEVEGAHNFVDAEGLILVHNTDSIFLLMGEKEKEDALSFMKKINDSLPGDMELELEGFYPRGVFVTKKHMGKEDKGAKKKYALIGEDGRIKIRGFELVRRDWSNVAKTTQRKVLEAILKDGSKEKAVKIVKDIITELKGGKVPLEDLTIYTQMRKDPNKYDIVSPEISAAKKAAEAGMQIEKGMMIGYVITKKGATISDKAQLVELARDYDPNYYIDNQVLPSVLKILKELGYSEDDLKFKGEQKGLSSFF